MVEDFEDLDELNDFVNGLSEAYQDELSDSIDAKRDDLTDEEDVNLGGITTAEVIDLLEARPGMRDAVEDAFFTDEEDEEGSEDAEPADQPEDNDEPSDEEEDTEEEKDNTEDEEEETSADEDASEDDEDEDTDKDEADEDDEQEDASGLEGLTITDDEDFDAEEAASRLTDYAEDNDLPANAFLAEDDDNRYVPVADVKDGEVVLSKNAIQSAKERLEDADISDDTREAGLGVLETLTEEIANAVDDDEQTHEAARQSLVDAAERMGIEDAESMTLDQLSVAINNRSSQPNSPGQTDEYTARDFAGVLTGRKL